MKNFQKNKLKDRGICNLNVKEFEIAVLKNLNKIQVNSGHLMNSEIKSMNKKNTLPKILKL